MAKPHDHWQRSFCITDHVKHKNGHILYKVTSIVYPKGKFEASTKIVVWKRYNDFKKLHAELKRRHAALRIGEDFPVLAKPKFFERFSDSVIIERKKNAVALLEFVARYPPLFTADIFVKFFQSGYYLTDVINADDGKSDESSSSSDCHKVDTKKSNESLNMGQVQSEGMKNQKSNYSNNEVVRKMREEINENSNSFRQTDSTMPASSKGSSFVEKHSQFFSNKEMPTYWEEATAHAHEAQQQEILGNFDVSFTMYKTAIVCLLSGVQGDTNMDHRRAVKEKTSEYLLRAEWIYNNHLLFPVKSDTTLTIPWRSRSQLDRYRIIDVMLPNNLLVEDTTDNIFVVIKGVLKSSDPFDRSERCILPIDVPYMVTLYAIHETDTTVFLVLQHIRYGKLWDHLEHYFSPNSEDNVETEVTCTIDENGDETNSIASTNSEASGSELGLSRLDSSVYTELSCESLSSHDENYFDLIEDYARVKNQKLKEIQDFNERRKHMECIKTVKKTASEVDLKSMDDEFLYRSQSLNNISCDAVDQSDITTSDNNSSEDVSKSLKDIDTQQLLKNAQRLIESINETLLKSEIVEDKIFEDKEEINQSDNISAPDYEEINEFPKIQSQCSPATGSVPSITEEYSVTGVIQRNGLTEELVKTWAAQLLIAINTLHQHDIVCRDLNPDNILLNENGSIVLTYFFRYPNVDQQFNEEASVNLYAAPEVTPFSNISPSADWWTYGAILYELITLKKLKSSHPGGIHSHTIINIPKNLPADSRSILQQLLQYEPNDRLGSGTGGVEDIKFHPYFSSINWDQF